jgi:DNA-binding response OmpR family regulator
MAVPGKVFTRAELLDKLYPAGEAVIDRVIDVHIGKLREKIEEDPANPRWILTVRGIGYQFTEEKA